MDGEHSLSMSLKFETNMKIVSTFTSVEIAFSMGRTGSMETVWALIEDVERLDKCDCMLIKSYGLYMWHTVTGLKLSINHAWTASLRNFILPGLSAEVLRLPLLNQKRLVQLTIPGSWSNTLHGLRTQITRTFFCAHLGDGFRFVYVYIALRVPFGLVKGGIRFMFSIEPVTFVLQQV